MYLKCISRLNFKIGAGGLLYRTGLLPYRSTWFYICWFYILHFLVSLVYEQQGTRKSTSSESFDTFDEVIQVESSYKPSSDKTDAMPLS